MNISYFGWSCKISFNYPNKFKRVSGIIVVWPEYKQIRLKLHCALYYGLLVWYDILLKKFKMKLDVLHYKFLRVSVKIYPIKCNQLQNALHPILLSIIEVL